MRRRATTCVSGWLFQEGGTKFGWQAVCLDHQKRIYEAAPLTAWVWHGVASHSQSKTVRAPRPVLVKVLVC